MAASITDIDAELTTIEGIDTSLATAVQQVITDLQAKAGSVDLTPELTRLQNIATALQSVQTDAISNDPGVPAPTAPTA